MKPLLPKAGLKLTGILNPEKYSILFILLISILPLNGPERYNKFPFLITYLVSNKTQIIKAVTSEIIIIGTIETFFSWYEINIITDKNSTKNHKIVMVRLFFDEIKFFILDFFAFAKLMNKNDLFLH